MSDETPLAEPTAQDNAGTVGPYLLTPIPSKHVPASHDLIGQAAQAVKPGAALVLGAGECTDIPLGQLLARFAKITINDVDSELLARGIEQAGLDESSRAKLDIQVADLTGSTQPLLEQVDAILATADTADVAVEPIVKLLSEFMPHGMHLEGHYDLVVASCVLSQLHHGVLHGTSERFTRRFPDCVARLHDDPRFSQAMAGLARRMEERFVSDLLPLIAERGLIYLSDTPQMSHIELTDEGQWRTPGTHRMLRDPMLADYISHRFAIVERGRWEWIADAPTKPGDVGRMYDVQALVMRVWRS